MSIQSFRLCVVFTSLVFCSAGIAAETAAAEAQAANTRGGIETIVVTAERRETLAQETSVALTAFTQQDLDVRGITNVEDLQFNVPNLVISHNSQSPVTYAYIRGIGSDQLVAGFDPGVAYHVDGVYIGQPSSMPGDLWDMQRVEVLRGVQGTLYGRNTTGGAINVITQDPTPEFDAIADVTGGNYDRKRFRGVVNGGTEFVSGRLSVITDENDGYQNNLIAGTNGDVTDYQSVRGKLKFVFGEGLDLVLTAQRFENEGNQSQKKGEQFTAPVYNGAIPNPTNPRNVAKDYPEVLNLGNNLYAAKVTWELDGFTLVSNTAYVNSNWWQTTDNDASSNNIQYQTWGMSVNQTTQEFQIISSGDGPWEWIGGAFYFDEQLSSNYNFSDVSPFGFIFFNGGDLETTSYAAYGQVGYDFRDSGTPIKIVAGARWTDDDKSIDEYQRIPAFGVNRAASTSETWSEPTGKVELDWFLGENVMSYATIARGYKGGGFSLGQFDTYDPEIVDSLELGLKSQFADNRAQVNVAAFYNDYQDLQVNSLVFISFQTDNAGAATIQGIELETVFLPLDQLQLSFNATWLDATFDTYLFTPAVGQPTVSLAGETLNRAPKSTYLFSAQYEWGLGNYGTLMAVGSYYWQDKVYYRVQNIPRHRENAFDTTNFRLLWTSPGTTWVVDAFVENAQDNDNLRGMTIGSGTSIGNLQSVSYFPPQVYGVRVAWHLGGGN